MEPGAGAWKRFFEHAGGEKAIRRFIEVFYASVLSDPVLQPLFDKGQPTHVEHLTAFDVETFGGPDRLTRELDGFYHVIAVHKNLMITQEQGDRFISLYMSAADKVGLPNDAPFRQALREHVEFGVQVAMQNSHTKTDDELYPLREVPKWDWPAQLMARQRLIAIRKRFPDMTVVTGRPSAGSLRLGRMAPSQKISPWTAMGRCMSAFILITASNATILSRKNLRPSLSFLRRSRVGFRGRRDVMGFWWDRLYGSGVRIAYSPHRGS